MNALLADGTGGPLVMGSIAIREGRIVAVGKVDGGLGAMRIKVNDPATYDDPHPFAEGFSEVIVNGMLVLRDGQLTGERSGRVLRGVPGRQAPVFN